MSSIDHQILAMCHLDLLKLFQCVLGLIQTLKKVTVTMQFLNLNFGHPFYAEFIQTSIVSMNYVSFLFQPPSRHLGSGSATLGRKPSSGIPKWSSPAKDPLGGNTGNTDLMTRSTLSRQCVSNFVLHYYSLLLTMCQ